MTTIAYKDGILAGDGRMTADNHIMGDDYVKVHILKDGTLIGFAGAVGEIIELSDSMLKAGKFDPKKKLDYESMSAIAITTDGTVWEYCDEFPRFINSGKKQMHALGSGDTYALGAMAAGSTAMEAIEIAKKFDSQTGGTTRFVMVQK